MTAGPRTLGAVIQRTSTILLAIHVAGACLLFLYNLALARLLGREVYGVFVYIENISELLLPLALLGLPQTVVRYVSVYRAERQWQRLRGLLRVARLGSFAAAVLCGAGAWVAYAWLWPEPMGTDAWTLAVGLALLPVLAALHIDQSVLQGLRTPIAAMLPNQFVRPVLAIGATGAVWWLGQLDLTTALILFLASLVVTEAVTALLARRQLMAAGGAARGATDVERFQEWLGMSWILLGVSVMRRLLHRVNIVMIGALASAGEVGLFGISFQATRFIAFASASVGMVSGPYVAAMFHARDLAKLQAVFDDTVRWAAVITVPISAVFVMFGQQLFGLFGESYEGAYPSFVTLVIAQLVGVLTGPTASMLTMAGDQRWLLASLVAGALFNVGTSAWLVPTHGAFGAALGTLAGLIVANAAMLAVLHGKYGLRLRFRWRTVDAV